MHKGNAIKRDQEDKQETGLTDQLTEISVMKIKQGKHINTRRKRGKGINGERLRKENGEDVDK